MGGCLGQRGAPQPLGQRAGGGGDAERSRRRRRGARRPAGRRPDDDVHRVAGAAADDPQPLQDRRRADGGGDPRGLAGPGHLGPVDLRRPQRCDGHPRHRLRAAVRRQRAGSRRLRRHRHGRQPGGPSAVAARLRWVPHLPRDPAGGADRRRHPASPGAGATDRGSPRPRTVARPSGAARHQPEPGPGLPGPRSGESLP